MPKHYKNKALNMSQTSLNIPEILSSPQNLSIPKSLKKTPFCGWPQDQASHKGIHQADESFLTNGPIRARIFQNFMMSNKNRFKAPYAHMGQIWARTKLIALCFHLLIYASL